MKKFAYTVLGAMFLSGAVLAAPQGFNQPATPQGPAGFNNAAPNTVAEILSRGYDDQIVTIQGRLTNFLGHDKYEFTDVAGDRIEVELDDDYNWSNISKDQLIEITGEIDKDLLSTTLDVKMARPVVK